MWGRNFRINRYENLLHNGWIGEVNSSSCSRNPHWELIANEGGGGAGEAGGEEEDDDDKG